ncbi:MAG: hypothetical protein AB1710_07505 [Pseudomonadota bacterium]|jgi:hypothetical protein
MPLSWNEIKSRAFAFSKEWAGADSENAQAKPFWIEFFNVFGISSKRVAFLFERYWQLVSLQAVPPKKSRGQAQAG